MTAHSRPNVLFIVLDTARFSSVFAETGPTVMPTVEKLASEGTNFEQAIANAPWTFPSHASMFTGLYASDHGSHAGSKRFDPPYAPLAERFADAGYHTAAFSNNTWLSPPFGFDRGFETFRTRWELIDGGRELASVAKTDGVVNKIRTLFRELVNFEAPLTLINFLYAASLSYRSTEDSGAKRSTRRLLDWLDNDREEPFFGFVNYVEPHLQYDPPQPFREKFVPEGVDPDELDRVEQDPWRYLVGELEMTNQDFEALLALYKAELNYLDSRIEQIYNRLDRDGILDETVIIVVGDHGENIGDHGLMDHQYCLYDTLLHVPCIIRYPETFEPGTCVKEIVELRDLFPTLLELAGLPVPDHPNVSEHSLVKPTEWTVGREYAIAEYLAPQPSMDALRTKVKQDLSESVTKYDRSLRAIRSDEWKYIEGSDGSEELYDLTTDPGETENVINDNQTTAERLRKLLESDRGTFTSTVETTTADVDAITEQRLEDLGYL